MWVGREPGDPRPRPEGVVRLDRRRSLAAPVVAFGLALAGCVALGPGGGESGLPSAGSPSSPSHGGAAGWVPGAPGASPSSPDAPIFTSPGGGPGDGVVPDPTGTLVTPRPGVIDPRPVAVQRVGASLEGGRVVVRLDWVSGVEPCSVLASVGIARDGATFTLTVYEGPTDLGVACIEIAMYKATLVDLGALPAGAYVVRAVPGDAPAVTIVVP